jgi:hypothetical protein
MYLVHRQHSPDIINDDELHYPKLDSAIALFYSLYVILVKLADTFANDLLQNMILCIQATQREES